MPTEFATSSATGQAAFNEFGLTSLQNMAKDKAVEAGVSAAAKFGLSSVLKTVPQIYAFYSVLDALGFFDGGGLEATSMTPEQREMGNAAAKASQALARLGRTSFNRWH